jgi:hypothetical protein
VLIREVNSNAKSVQGSYRRVIAAEEREQANKERGNWNEEYGRLQEVSL